MWRKLLFFGALYFLQGAVLAYIFNFQKPYLQSQGVSKEAIGTLTSLLLLPFIGKVLIGMLSDRLPVGRFGSRKPYMIVGILAFAICFFALSLIDARASFFTFAAVMWTASLFLALFDTCTDGLAVDVSQREEQSAVQAAMVAGKALGMTLMSLGIGYVAIRHGFKGVFIFLGALALASLCLVVFTRFERQTPTGDQLPEVDRQAIFTSAFLMFALYGVVYSVASFGTDGLLTLHYSEVLGAGALGVGVYGMVKGLGAIVGAVTFGWWPRRFGLRRAHLATLVVVGFGCLLPLTPLAGLPNAAIWGFCWGMGETAFVVLAMRFASGAWAATIFAFCMIFSNVGTAIGEALGAPLVPAIGYAGVYILFAICAWSSLPLARLAYAKLKQGEV